MAMLAMGYTTMLHAAQRGDPPFQAPMADFRGIVNVNVAGVLHAFVLEDTGITVWRDFAAQEYPLTVDTGPRGTGGELAASRALELYGAGYDNIKAWGGSITHSNYREAIDRMKDGHIEAFINDDIVGNPTFVDLALARDVLLLPLDPDAQGQMIERFGYAEAVIPAGTYRGQDTDIASTAQHFVLFCHKDVPEDLVYAMTRLVFENKDDLVAAHQLFSDLDPAVGPLHFPIPLHAGAERYYREIGVLE
jgi:TRAP transporter TAXI family solute receptor